MTPQHDNSQQGEILRILYGLQADMTTVKDEVHKLRTFRHEAGNIVQGWPDVQHTQDDLQRRLTLMEQEFKLWRRFVAGVVAVTSLMVLYWKQLRELLGNGP